MSYTEKQWIAKAKYFDSCCYYCGKSLTKNTLTMDHAIPKAMGGPDELWNLFPCCGRCNSMKGSRKTAARFIYERSGLCGHLLREAYFQHALFLYEEAHRTHALEEIRVSVEKLSRQKSMKVCWVGK